MSYENIKKDEQWVNYHKKFEIYDQTFNDILINDPSKVVKLQNI